ncbi:MAG: energy transducer TonB [Bacteroidetes bacterium]|nr:energy transducer TonB [Bacteroidota bacterium]
MSDKVNIYSDEWCDMVFANKNHEYGAFVLRKGSSRRHLRAILIAVIFFTLAVSSPVILKTILPEKKVAFDEVTKITDVKLDKPKEDKVIIEEEQPISKSTIQFVPPVIKADEDVPDDVEIKTQDDLSQSKEIISTTTFKGDDVNGVDPSELNTNQKIADDGGEGTPFTIVEQQPDFPGGEAEMKKFLLQNMKYPTMARESGIEGTVFVTFVVSKSGKISSIKILRGIGGGCDEEAIRVIKMMPEWKPGKQNGQAVPVQFNMPIKFSLQ